MALVSHPALSPEWSFPSPVNPFDAASFSHIELTDHTANVGAVHVRDQLHAVNKRRAHEIEWDDEDAVERVESRVKKAKTSAVHTVDPQQLHGVDNTSPHLLSSPQVPSAPSPHIEQVISIIVDALTSPPPAPPPPTPAPEPPSTAPTNSSITVSVSSNALATTPSPISRPVPTSPLSDCPTRAPFVRKAIGGSCAGKTEASLCRWVLCKNHFLGVRCLDPTIQSSEWVQTLHEMGWEELHPYYQAQAAAQNEQTFGALSAFSRWIEDEFDYDGTEDGDGEWSDEEDEDGEMHDDIREEDDNGQRGVWDSGVVLQLPGKSC